MSWCHEIIKASNIKATLFCFVSVLGWRLLITSFAFLLEDRSLIRAINVLHFKVVEDCYTLDKELG